MKKYHHYDKNIYINNSPINKTFAEVLQMSTDEFKNWIIDVRKTIVDIWDNKGIPPVNGYTRDEIIEQFNKLESFPVHEMFIKDDYGELCVRNTHNKMGNACNSWFPTMGKTPITYSETLEAKSIYDFLKEDDMLKRYMPYGFRHFKRDSFYEYSQCVKEGDLLPSYKNEKPKSAPHYIELFEKYEMPLGKYDYWISEIDKDKKYTGYNEKLINAKFYELSFEEFDALQEIGIINRRETVSNIKEYGKDSKYQIRLYDKSVKIFPSGLKSFRISVCQMPANFPPVIAKAIWERYTEEFKDENEIAVWDPSCGWGGRILGAMAVKSDRNIKYLGTDPNKDHGIYWGGVHIEGEYNKPGALYTKYDDLAKFYNTETSRSKNLFPHTNDWEVWQLGSEEIQHDTEFQKYKGRLSVVFTSPPYFNKEKYSQDKEQSCNKFSDYKSWKNGFLYETLKTAYEWLRPGGYLVWNISDIKLGKDTLPLEKDSWDIIESFGMKHVEDIKLVLAQMSGSGRTKKDEESGEIVSTNKNGTKINGKFFRFEPIRIYRKPK